MVYGAVFGDLISCAAAKERSHCSSGSVGFVDAAGADGLYLGNRSRRNSRVSVHERGAAEIGNEHYTVAERCALDEPVIG